MKENIYKKNYIDNNNMNIIKIIYNNKVIKYE